MKKIKVPTFLHPFLGKETTLPFIVLLILFSIGMTFLTIWLSDIYFGVLETYRQVLLVILMMDIYGGIIANFSPMVHDYYHEHPNLRKIFVLVHPHALLLPWLTLHEFRYGLYVYALLVAFNFIIFSIKKRNIQEIVAIGVNLGMGALIFTVFGLDTWVAMIYLSLVIKLIYGFSVDPVKEVS